MESADTEEYNQAASHYSRSGISVQELIEECIEVRSILIQKLMEQKDTVFCIAYQIGNTKLAMQHYIEEMIEHDHHHCQQITEFLEQKFN